MSPRLRAGRAGRVALALALAVTVASPASANRRPTAAAAGPPGAAGNPRVFAAAYADPDGWRDLRSVRLEVRSSGEPGLGLAVRYRPAANRLSLRDGGRWRGSCRPGEATALAGPTGRLYCRHTRVLGSGTGLAVRWFLGVKQVLEDRELELRLRAADRGGASSGWIAGGPWSAPAPRPLPFSLFPPDNPWNADVSSLPRHPDSDAFIASIGLDRGLHADFGTAWQGSPIGIPYVLVRGDQPLVPVIFAYAEESDPGPYPVPGSPPIEGGPFADGDRHVLVLDVDDLLLYEMFDARRAGAGWSAGSGARFDLASNALRPDGWTSADAAGLPILPGLVRYEEVDAGAVDHALRFTASRTRRGYVHPATHFASSSTDPALPPMGLRVRLRADYDTSGFPPRVRAILAAMQRHGMLLADNGSDWYVSGAPNENWDDDELRLLGLVKGADFEAVDTGPILP